MVVGLGKGRRSPKYGSILSKHSLLINVAETGFNDASAKHTVVIGLSLFDEEKTSNQGLV